MQIIHKKLGPCKFLIQFEGKKNQMALVKAHKRQTADGLIGNRHNAKMKYWLLWGPLGMNIEDLGATCFVKANGSTYSDSFAMRKFVIASLTVDNMTMKKVETGAESESH